MPDLILSRIADLVCTITLNRPEKRNALSTEMIEALHATLTQVAAREDVRVVVLAGAGGVFCAGLDLRELAAQREAGRVETHPLQDALEEAASWHCTATSASPPTAPTSRCRSPVSASRCP